MPPDPRRAAIVGTGLIGASLGLALRRRGWHVTGRDADPERVALAQERGVVDAVGEDPLAEITFIATPVGAVVDAARRALALSPGVVTDVGGVKAPIVAALGDARFVGGHPMAGSEQVGVEGADPDLFEGAAWVLTPSANTSDESFLQVRTVVTALGADVVVIEPSMHDTLVAVVSHVPHLAAATLMSLADGMASDHRALLRLAAGGFRDMTRVASGDPGIWPDICVENSAAIIEALDSLMEDLASARELVAQHDRAGLLDLLERARAARLNLPVGREPAGRLAVVRVPIPDRPGMLAEITTLATELGINILDLEIAHSSEGDRGVAILMVEADSAQRLHDALESSGMRSSTRPLE